MAPATIGFGVALIILGAGAYLGSGRASVTALIPAFFGAAIAACGLIALRPARQRPALVVAGVLGLLGLAGSLSRIVPALFAGQGFQWSLATGSQIAMAAITLVFVAMIGWWLARRRTPAPAR